MFPNGFNCIANLQGDPLSVNLRKKCNMTYKVVQGHCLILKLRAWVTDVIAEKTAPAPPPASYVCLSLSVHLESLRSYMTIGGTR